MPSLRYGPTHYLDSLVVLGPLVWLKVVIELLRIPCDRCSVGRLKVLAHPVIEREKGSSRSNFGTHVADGGHTRAGK